MANPRKSNEQHVSDGTFRADRHGSRETAKRRDLVTELPTPPDYFGDYAMEHWATLGRQMILEEKLTNAELFLFTTVCQQYEMLRELRALEMLRREEFDGQLVMDDPEIVKCRQEWRMLMPQYQKALTDLGLGAVARSQASQSIPQFASGGIPRKPVKPKAG